jgi:hypothetical protein
MVRIRRSVDGTWGDLKRAVESAGVDDATTLEDFEVTPMGGSVQIEIEYLGDDGTGRCRVSQVSP